MLASVLVSTYCDHYLPRRFCIWLGDFRHFIHFNLVARLIGQPYRASPTLLRWDLLFYEHHRNWRRHTFRFVCKISNWLISTIFCLIYERILMTGRLAMAVHKCNERWFSVIGKTSGFRSVDGFLFLYSRLFGCWNRWNLLKVE